MEVIEQMAGESLFVPPNPLTTAVLLLVFNRPKTTCKVFEAIRKARPRRLYIAADGPRPSSAEDGENCRQVRQIVAQVDWGCRVETLFRNENVGCQKAISKAIDWFFEHEASGIILEDDCVPSQSFFWFCQQLLERYHDDQRIMHINGTNFFWNRKFGGSTYFYSKYGNIWGWATWRRAWAHYDAQLTDWENIKILLDNNGFYGAREMAVRKDQIEQIRSGLLDTWDYQWIITKIMQSGLSVIPSVNLVKNIGFISESTHTKPGRDIRSDLPLQEIAFPLRPMKYMSIDATYERLMRKRVVGRYHQKRFIKMIKRVLSR
jgi:hypothetical protein